MPLESLSQPFNPDEPGRKLREVQVEQEGDRENHAEHMYYALKDSGFYDTESQLWRLGENGTVTAPWDQFLGITALAEFDPSSARQQWEALCHEETFNAKEVMWSWGELESSVPTAKLASIVILLQFDRAEGAAEYAKFCQQVNGADARMMPQPLSGDYDISTDTELYHILIGATLNPREARSRYDALQATKLYDKASHLWHSDYFTESRDTSSSFYSDLSLLSILAELDLGIPGAAERYEAVKLSPLFDQERQLWNESLFNNEVFVGRCTSAQLLSVIIESRIEKKQKIKKLSAKHEIPEERNF